MKAIDAASELAGYVTLLNETTFKSDDPKIRVNLEVGNKFAAASFTRTHWIPGDVAVLIVNKAYSLGAKTTKFLSTGELYASFADDA